VVTLGHMNSQASLARESRNYTTSILERKSFLSSICLKNIVKAGTARTLDLAKTENSSVIANSEELQLAASWLDTTVQIVDSESYLQAIV
jgi:hypothetical protein